jgi:hypothetical protein
MSTTPRNHGRPAWLPALYIALALGLLVGGHLAARPAVAALVQAGHAGTVETLAAPVEPPGQTQNSRMAYSFSGELPPASAISDLEQRVRIRWARIWLVLMMLLALRHLAVHRSEWSDRLRQLFAETEHPYTLALLRILVFGWLLSRHDTRKLLLYADFPRELAMPPPGLAWALAGPLLGKAAMAVIGPLYAVCCFLAMVGFCTRPAAAVAIALGVYVGGIPKLFGATVYHHVMYWLGAVCAAAPSGDALSVDALWTAYGCPQRGLARASERRTAYAIPLRIIWLLFAMLYFFPGVWKLWNCGLDWFKSSNLAGAMHGRWLDAHMMPQIRVDHMPLVLTLGAINAVIFELCFPLAILYRRTRRIALVEGVVFHGLNKLLLYFDFVHILYCYLVFFDCRGLLARCGRVLLGAPRHLGVDVRDGGALRAAALLRTVDLFDALVIDSSDAAEPGRGVWLVGDARARSGRAALAAVLPRLPLAWPLLPILWPLIFYALRRGSPAPAPAQPDRSPDRAARLALFTGLFILTAGSLAGARELDRGWPFACYPPFAWLSGEYRHVLRITVETPGSPPQRVDEGAITKQLGPQWKAQLFGQVLLTADEATRNARLLAMWRLYQKLDPRLRSAVRAQLDEVRIRIDPDAPGEQLTRHLLTWQKDPAGGASGASR